MLNTVFMGAAAVPPGHVTTATSDVLSAVVTGR